MTTLVISINELALIINQDTTYTLAGRHSYVNATQFNTIEEASAAMLTLSEKLNNNPDIDNRLHQGYTPSIISFKDNLCSRCHDIRAAKGKHLCISCSYC